CNGRASARFPYNTLPGSASNLRICMKNDYSRCFRRVLEQGSTSPARDRDAVQKVPVLCRGTKTGSKLAFRPRMKADTCKRIGNYCNVGVQAVCNVQHERVLLERRPAIVSGLLATR